MNNIFHQANNQDEHMEATYFEDPENFDYVTCKQNIIPHDMSEPSFIQEYDHRLSQLLPAGIQAPSTQNPNPLSEKTSSQLASTAKSFSTITPQPFSHADSILLIRQQQQQREALREQHGYRKSGSQQNLSDEGHWDLLEKKIPASQPTPAKAYIQQEHHSEDAPTQLSETVQTYPHLSIIPVLNSIVLS